MLHKKSGQTAARVIHSCSTRLMLRRKTFLIINYECKYEFEKNTDSDNCKDY